MRPQKVKAGEERVAFVQVLSIADVILGFCFKTAFHFVEHVFRDSKCDADTAVCEEFSLGRKGPVRAAADDTASL